MSFSRKYIYPFFFLQIGFCTWLHCSPDEVKPGPAPTLVANANTLLYKTKNPNQVCFQITNRPSEVTDSEILVWIRQDSAQIQLSIQPQSDGKYCSLVSSSQLEAFHIGKASIMAQIKEQQIQDQILIGTRPIQFGYSLDPVVPVNEKVETRVFKTGISSEGEIVAIYQDVKTSQIKINCFFQSRGSDNIFQSNSCPYDKVLFDPAPVFWFDFLDNYMLVGSAPNQSGTGKVRIRSCPFVDDSKCIYSQAINPSLAPSDIKALALFGDQKVTPHVLAADGQGLLRLFAFDMWPGTTVAEGPKAEASATLIAQGDMDNNGIRDVIAIDQGFNGVVGARVFMGGTNYHAAFSEGLSRVLTGSSVTAIAVGDVDQDGLMDFIFSRGITIFFAINQADGSFRLDPFQLNTRYPVGSLAYGDVAKSKDNTFIKDGKPDLIVMAKDLFYIVDYPNLSLGK